MNEKAAAATIAALDALNPYELNPTEAIAVATSLVATYIHAAHIGCGEDISEMRAHVHKGIDMALHMLNTKEGRDCADDGR